MSVTRAEQYPVWEAAARRGLTKDRLWEHIDHLCLDDETGPVAQEMLRLMATTTRPDYRAAITRAMLAWSREEEPCIHPGVFAIDSTTPRFCPACRTNVPACDL